MKILITRLTLAGLLWTGALQTAQAQLSWSIIRNYEPPVEVPTYTRERLAKTGPDECFNGIGIDYPPLNPDGTCSVGVPKANQGYIWGLTQAGLNVPSFAGDEIWFGTIANPLCTAPGGIFLPEPVLTVSWACEYGQSMQSRRPQAPLPAAVGDWRLPRSYSYNLTTHTLTDRTPNDPNYKAVTGLRSAGSVGNMVFLAGPNFKADVVFAAWDAATGSYKGSCRTTALNNIRQWITVNGVLYAGVGRRTGDGAILRWRGTTEQPFNGASSPSEYCGFEVVGVLPDLPAYLANYDGKRMAASVWSDSQRDTGDAMAAKARKAAAAPAVAAPPSAAASSGAGGIYSAGVYIGPLFGTDGQYASTDATAKWLKVWTPAQYDPDPVVSAVTAGGAIAFWKGWLWFGTIHNTTGAYQAHTLCSLPACFGLPANSNEEINVLFNVSRAASLWRARLTDGGGPEVQMLYGETALPAFVPGTKTFAPKPTGWTPRYGASGLGNPFLTYAWSATAGADDLLFGFYDYRYVFDVRLGVVPGPTAAGHAGPRPASEVDPTRGYGADLWRFTDPEAPAKPEANLGLDNFTNYGVRNMLRLNGGPEVILGTANAMNLEPEGGWELWRLTPPASSQAKGSVPQR